MNIITSDSHSHYILCTMDIFAQLYIIASLCIALLFEGAIVYSKIKTHKHSQQTDIQNSYIRQIVKMLFAEQVSAIYPHADTPQHLQALAEALHIVMSHTYGADKHILGELVEQTRLDIYLLRRVKQSRDIERSHILMLISAMPTQKPVSSLLRPYLYSSRSHVRTATLLALLAASPSTAIATISSISHNLTNFDIARIIMLLRRGILPIAYEPLLMSKNRNLRMLGLAIVRNFGIEIADKHLQNIIATSTDYAITKEALYTLSSLGRPLGRAKIRQRIGTMPPHLRKELCRHLTHEGYSLAALRTLFDQSEMLYTESLIKSYKRNLECTSTLST